MEVGSNISWKTVSKVASGVVEKINGDEFTVRLANGKGMIVNRSSIISNGKEESKH